MSTAPESAPGNGAPEPKAGKRTGTRSTQSAPTTAGRPVDAIVPAGAAKRSARNRAWLPWAIGGVGVLLVAAIAGTLLLGGGSPTANSNRGGNTNTATSAPRALDGVATTGETNPVPVAVMIENIVESRPPSGLDQASVVYEALAEGGITRFLAVFGLFENIPEIGPVRSARPYYVDWAEEYGALYVHAGGSPQALDLLRGNRYLTDFNQFAYGPYFWRDRGRAAPHNLYTSSDKLVFARRDLSIPETATFTPWTFAATEQGPVTAETQQSITIDFSSFNYRVEWKYDPATNAYQRNQAGAPHTVESGATVTAKNVVVQFVDAALLDAERLRITTVGSGRVRVFRDGRVIDGTWSKSERGARTRFLDSNGDPIALNPGTTWVEAVPNGRTVTVTPAPTP